MAAFAWTFRKFNTLALIVIITAAALDGFFWYSILDAPGTGTTHEYFLDVGQGDSELVVFPGNRKVLTDAGPPGVGALDALAEVLPPDDRYIDVAVVTHPEADHFGGYQFLIDGGWRFGVFVYSGRNADKSEAAWPALLDRLRANDIPLVTVGAGDSIHSGGDADGSDEIDILAPDKNMVRSAALNDTAIVERVKTPRFTALFTADMGFPGEERFLASPAARNLLRVDVLKVGHHGSKYSSGEDFLRAVAPKAAVIEVGAKNTYGHPSKEALARIASSTQAAIFRTDRDGTIEVFSESGVLKIVKRKQSTQ